MDDEKLELAKRIHQLVPYGNENLNATFVKERIGKECWAIDGWDFFLDSKISTLTLMLRVMFHP